MQFPATMHGNENLGGNVLKRSVSGSTHGQESAKKRAAFMDLSNTATAPQDDCFMMEDSCNASVNQASAAPSYHFPRGHHERQASHKQATSSAQVLDGSYMSMGVVDVDYAQRHNPLACSEYAQSIFAHLHEAELMPSRRPDPNYMRHTQSEVTPHMRSVLVDWLVEVGQEYKLCSDTLFQTVQLLDRLLSTQRIPREKLQLAGVACMWIAAKYEEIYAPTSKDFCYITDNTYSQVELVEMEAQVLAALNFELTSPTPKIFLRRYLQAANADERTHYLASYLCELSLLEADMLRFPPSQIAAAAVMLTNRLLGAALWSPTLQFYTNLRAQDVAALAPLAKLHAEACSTDFQYAAVRDKYAAGSMCRVALIAPLPAAAML